MSSGYQLANFIFDLLTVIKPNDEEWQKKHLVRSLERKAEKKHREAKIDHEIELLKVKFDEEIKRVKASEQKVTNDYKMFLDSIDKMKAEMLDTFTDMPEPMVLVIHHHAKSLIDGMWKSENEEDQALSRERFTEFLLAVYNDTQASCDKKGHRLPTETLKLVKSIS